MKRLAALIATAAAMALTAAPASAASGCATWGCGTATRQSEPPQGGWWNVTVTDTLTDGWCVEAWTYNRGNGARVERLAVSCGPTASGGGWSNYSSYGVRIYRGDGRFLTIA